MLGRKDKAGALSFTDISASTFRAEERGFSQARLMAEIHAVTPEGKTLVGVEVFRQMYERVGFPRLVALSRLWGLRDLLGWAYKVWAKNRLTLTGRRCDATCHL
jgi:predicted DCC family thiol-disulfide oxidoreductase YuxK